MKHLSALFLSTAILISALEGASATTVTFPDPGPGNYDFNPALTYSGVTFATGSPAIAGVGAGIGADRVNFFDDAFGGYINVSFAATTSFSALLAQGYAGSSGDVSISVLNGATSIFSETLTVGGQDSFTPFSISGIGAFTQVDISTAGFPQFPGIAQVQVGGVPEPTTWAMILLGFAGLGLMGHRASRKTVVPAA